MARDTLLSERPHPESAPQGASWRDAEVLPFEAFGLVGQRLDGFQETDVAALPWDAARLADAEGPVGQSDEVVCVKRSKSRSALTFMASLAGGERARVYAKRCVVRKRLRAALMPWRPSKCAREWALGRTLLFQGVNTAIPLLWAERREGGMLRASYLITLGVPDAVSFLSHWQGLTKGAEREEGLRHLARFIRAAHDRGFAHDDLSAEHVLIDTEATESDAVRSFHFIDLDQSRFVRRISPYRRAHNFFQVFRSLCAAGLVASERRAFLEAYFAGDPTDETINGYEKRIARVGVQKRWLKALKQWRL